MRYLVYFCKLLDVIMWLALTNMTAVYPETMGVPLEEMDAVFGEGV